MPFDNKKGAILTRMDGMEFVWKDSSFWRGFPQTLSPPKSSVLMGTFGGGFHGKDMPSFWRDPSFAKNHGSVETKSQTTMIFLYYP